MENINYKKIFFAVILVVFTILYLAYWRGCYLGSKFFFSKLDLNLQIIFDIRSDNGVPLVVSHLLYNKLTQGSVDVFNAYIHFFDIQFLIFSLSPVTFFGLLSFIYYKIKKKLRLSFFEKILIILIFCTPLVLLLNILKNTEIMLMIFLLPLCILSIKGVFSLIAHNKYAWVLVGTSALLSLWYLFMLSSAISNFCHL